MDETRDELERMLEERNRIDSVLKEKYTRDIAVMFTDIKGSTSFFEERGDLAGRSMIHRHNSVVIPVIEAHGGSLIKTIGDATMSTFDAPVDALKTAKAVQLALKEHNRNRAPVDRIHIRVGINYGPGIVEKNDVYGDVVNVASRVEALASGDEVFLSEEVYRAGKTEDDFIFRYVDSVTLKGKEEPAKIYRLIWQDEDMFLGRTRYAAEQPQKRDVLFVLEASVMGDNLKICAFERAEGEERAVKGYSEFRFNRDKISGYANGVIEQLNRANQRGKVGNDILIRLKELGALLFDELIPPDVKEQLSACSGTSLLLSLDDSLVHIPWEILYDGKVFLCQKFGIGRTVSTKQSVSVSGRAIGRPLKMQVLADPRGDLPAAYDEGIGIKNETGKYSDFLDLSLKTTDISSDYVKAKIRNFDVVHYAGHAEHVPADPQESGWLLKDCRLTARDIHNMAGGMPMPSLIFSNACQSGYSGDWRLGPDCEERIFGLANAFLLSGVQHYIGTFWEIPDEAGAHFALSFYRHLITGATIGEAVRLAREALIEKYGEDTVVWASYLLYGDPTTRYIQLNNHTEHTVSDEIISSQSAASTFIPPSAPEKSHLKTGIIAATLVVVLAILGLLLNGNKPAPAVNPVRQAGVDGEDDGKRLDALVTELADHYRKGGGVPKKSGDLWSSRPLSLAVMELTTDGADPNAVVTRLNAALLGKPGIKAVDRELLNKLLAELKLSSSSLADPATALRLGKVLSARIMIAGSLSGTQKDRTITLKLIDTETTEIKTIITTSLADKEPSASECEQVAQKISEWGKTEFPLRGRITSLAEKNCRINLGKDHGLEVGNILEILKEAGGGIDVPTGEIKVVEVGKDTSVASIISGGTTVREKEKVRVKNL